MDFVKVGKKKFSYMRRASEAFMKHVDLDDTVCHGLFMLSGGKDSIYALVELAQRYKTLNLKTYTLLHPYMSDAALNNINAVSAMHNYIQCFEKFPFDTYKDMFQKEFNNSNHYDFFDAHRLPCHICVCLSNISAYIYAYKMGIKYILVCTDPEQVGTAVTSGKECLDSFVSLTSREMADRLFGRRIIDELVAEDEKNLPCFITPYVSLLDYNRDKMILKIKDLGIYNSNTECLLSPLLYYYSISKYGVYNNINHLANEVRRGHLDRDSVLRFLKQYNELLSNVSIGDIPENTREQFLRVYIELFKVDTNDKELLFQLDNVLNISQVADCYGISDRLLSDETLGSR